MATNGTSSTNTLGATERSYFEQQRAALVGDIALSLEQVLQNLNHLNRSLEGVIAVGNEFGSVEALWSQFEGVMGNRDDQDNPEGKESRQTENEDGQGGDEEKS